MPHHQGKIPRATTTLKEKKDTDLAKQSKSPKKEDHEEDSAPKKSKSPKKGNKAKTSNKSKSPPHGRVIETLDPDIDIIKYYDGDYTPPKKDPHGCREAMDMTEELRRGGEL